MSLYMYMYEKGILNQIAKIIPIIYLFPFPLKWEIDIILPIQVHFVMCPKNKNTWWYRKKRIELADFLRYY